MTDTRNPPGYIPLTIHQLSGYSGGNSNGGGRSAENRSGGDRQGRNGSRKRTSAPANGGARKMKRKPKK